MIDDVAVAALVAAAAYEAVAFWSRKVPTITRIVNSTPRLVRLALLVGAACWAVDHFEVV